MIIVLRCSSNLDFKQLNVCMAICDLSRRRKYLWTTFRACPQWLVASNSNFKLLFLFPIKKTNQPQKTEAGIDFCMQSFLGLEELACLHSIDY